MLAIYILGLRRYYSERHKNSSSWKSRDSALLIVLIVSTNASTNKRGCVHTGGCLFEEVL